MERTVGRVGGLRVQLWQMLSAFLLIGLVSALGFTVRRDEFPVLISLYGVAFFFYWAIFSRVSSRDELRFFLWLAILLRVLLVFAFPQLSDDVYRFVWDGRLLVAGISPFAELPGYYLQPGHEVPGLTPTLYEQLNSPNYHTVYPPLAQGVYWLACALFPKSLAGSVLVMKAVLLACEIGTLSLLPRLLRAFKLPARNALLYALNPLILLEVMGNLHFEGMVVFFLLAGLYWIKQERIVVAAGAWALSVAAKMLPLMFLPLLIPRLGWRRAMGFSIMVIGLNALMWWPFTGTEQLAHLGESLDLYFRKFEFNASVYYLARAIGQWWLGYNPIQTIGPWLAFFTLAAILGITFLGWDRRMRTLPLQMLLAITIYLLLATTVHPWYLGIPLALCLLTPLRFPVWWTLAIFLTYINYSYDPYWENGWVVTLEYAFLGLVLIKELFLDVERPMVEV